MEYSGIFSADSSGFDKLSQQETVKHEKETKANNTKISRNR